MVQRLGKALLALSVMVPMQMQGSKSCETLCNLIITKCLRVRGNEVVDGNLTVNGTLTVGGVNFSNLAGLASAIGAAGATGATGPAGAAGLTGVIASIIPYASGAGATTASPIVLSGVTAGSQYVLGFGDNLLLTPAAQVDPALTATYGSFAYIVPRAGTLSNLWGSIDANFLITGAGTGPFTFTYTIFHSSAVNGATTPYTATPLSTTTTLTAPAATPTGTNLRTAFSNTTASIPVAAGDRIVLVITVNTTVGATAVGAAGFQAGVVYTPA